MKLRNLISVWRERLNSETAMGVAVFVFPAITALVYLTLKVLGVRALYARDLPWLVQPFAYLLAAIWIWSGFKILDGLYSHAWHLQASPVERLFWIAAMTILLPLGPIIYYFAVYRTGAPALPKTDD